MDASGFRDAFDATTDSALAWLGDNAAGLFDAARAALEGLYGGVFWLLQLVPYYAVALALAVLGWRLTDAWFGLAAAVALALCAAMGLWPETMSTLALVITATFLALLVALPAGVVAGFVPALDRGVEPVLDLIQTMPPYIYLLPAIALLGYGPATALLATVVVAVPPALRLTALGIRMTPAEYVELGRASGLTGSQMLFKIRLPFAMPSIMAGIN